MNKAFLTGQNGKRGKTGNEYGKSENVHKKTRNDPL